MSSTAIPRDGAANPVQCSDRFNQNDADLAIYSADNVIFRIHSKNLEVNTGAFPPFGSFPSDEAVHLSESGTTLELLFQFIYPERHPTLEQLGFAELSQLSEAVEKYEVFPAMFVCHYRMGKFLSTNPLELMIYAGRHFYEDYLDDAAPRLMGGDLKDATRRMPEPVYDAWCRYYELWEQVHQEVLNFNIIDGPQCYCWKRVSRRFLCELGRGVKAMSELDRVFAIDGTGCGHCISACDGWEQHAKDLVAEIPRFSTLL